MRHQCEQDPSAGGHENAASLVDLALTLLHPADDRHRDFEQAHVMLAKAGELGNLRALRLRASLLATGTGCRADSNAALSLMQRCAAAGDQLSGLQLVMLSRMVGRAVSSAEQLSTEPLVELRRGFLTKEECGYLIVNAEPRFEPSVIFDPDSGERRPDPVRTSDGMSFGPLAEDMVIHAINHRIATATGTPFDHGEPLHMLRYRGEQEYRPHCDALPRSGNLRHWTVLLYLNDEYVGGETEFPLLGIKVRGSAGDMLRFCNVDDCGRSNPLSRHAGLPVTSGTKYIATRWIREKPYHPWA